MNRCGAALAEVVVAITLLAVVGLSAAATARSALEHIRKTAFHAAQVREASGFMTAVALWPTDDLDRRLGIRPQGPWLLSISRVSDSLYGLTVMTQDSVVLISTRVFRPE